MTAMPFNSNNKTVTMEKHYISAQHITVEDLARIVENGIKIELSDDARQRVLRCRSFLDDKIERTSEPIYGITTGFGSLCSVSIDKDSLSTLQRNLVMSHSCGMGDEVPAEIVKYMLLLKVQSLCYGYSGVQLPTVERLVAMFNEDITPIVYQQGSLGASGDLAPLANMCLPLLGLGEVRMNGERMSGEELNKRMGWQPITLASKEGLALLNGTQFMSAYSVWSLARAKRLSVWSDVIATMSLEAYDGLISPFYASAHIMRPHKGQVETAKRIYTLLEGSEMIARHKEHVQDPYSFRCVPQVHGAVKDALDYVERVVTTEVNSATDNPIVVPDEDMVISAGNFHGEPLALANDFLAISLSELASISGQRTYQLISGKRGLPAFLVAKPGLNSGFMIPQYAVASIVSQNKQLSTPASVDSIESSLGQEDHVSMGANAATECARVVDNVYRVLGVELMNAAQALEFRRPLKSSTKIERLFDDYRKQVAFVDVDRVMYTDMAKSEKFLRENDAAKYL